MKPVHVPTCFTPIDHSDRQSLVVGLNQPYTLTMVQCVSCLINFKPFSSVLFIFLLLSRCVLTKEKFRERKPAVRLLPLVTQCDVDQLIGV